jgi:hypothetical protein
MKRIPAMPRTLRATCVLAVVLSFWTMARAEDTDVIRPTKPIQLFNGKNLDGLYTWLSDAKYEDPRKVFTVKDGILNISGEGMGYICTKDRYKDYHLVAEYRWGERTWASRKKAARDSGIILHCVGPDGSFNNVFMAGIEAQVIEGGVGDILVVNAKKPDGTLTNVTLAAEITKDRDGETVWKKGGERTVFNTFGRINWYGRDVDWTDTLNFRGKQDLDSPGREWTRLDVICDGGHVLYKVNGVLANEAFDASPSFGKILFQTEGAEIDVRRLELLPLEKK